MGSSSSSSTVIQEHTTVIINGYNANRAKLGSGLRPLPDNTPYAQVAKEYVKAMNSALTALWSAGFPSVVMNPTQIANGFLIQNGPLKPGMSIDCAAALIDQELKNWNAVTSGNFTGNVVQTLLTGLINSAGTTFKATGSQPESASQSTDWAAVTIPFAAGTGPTAVTLVGYSFTAATVVSL